MVRVPTAETCVKFFAQGADLAEKSVVECFFVSSLNLDVSRVGPEGAILFLDRREDRLVDEWVTSIITNDIVVDDNHVTVL